MSIKEIIQQENDKNRLHNIKQFEKSNECPFCEGYGEVHYEDDFKECPTCKGSGEWEILVTSVTLYYLFPNLGK